MRLPLALLSVMSITAGSTALAQTPPAGPPVTAATRAAVVEALGRELKRQYVFPDTATKVAAALSAKLRHGDYDAVSSSAAFGDALSKDLREIGKDGHFRVRFEPQFRPGPAGGQADDKRGDRPRTAGDGAAFLRHQSCSTAAGAMSVISISGASARRLSWPPPTHQRSPCCRAPTR